MPLSRDTLIYTICSIWLIWIAVWAALAFNNKRTIYRQPLTQRLAYIAAPLAASLLATHGPYFFRTRLLPSNTPTQLTAILLCLAGLAFSFWARFTLGTNWSGVVTLKENHELIQSGPYRLVRHPIYTGVLTMILGTMIALLPNAGGLILFATLAALFTLKLRQEEKIMLHQFPNQYPTYKSQVKALIPFLI